MLETIEKIIGVFFGLLLLAFIIFGILFMIIHYPILVGVLVIIIIFIKLLDKR